MTAGAWVYRVGLRCAADFIALLDRLLAAFPLAPVIAVICDNDSIHHARTVSAYLERHPRLELLYGARYSPHDNPAEMGARYRVMSTSSRRTVSHRQPRKRWKLRSSATSRVGASPTLPR